MNAKKWLMRAGILNAAFVAVCLFPGVLRHQLSGSVGGGNAQTGVLPAVRLTRLAGSSLGFGPVMEATLPAARGDGETEILDLETGRCLTRPALEFFDDDAAAMMTWTRTNGLNISGRVWPDGSAACVTYNMTVAPVAAGCWKEAAAKVISAIPPPAPGEHSPSRLLLLRPDRAETYVFRTDEGTLGMLRLAGLTDDRRAVKIHYKLLQARGDMAQSAPMPGPANAGPLNRAALTGRGSYAVCGSGNLTARSTTI